MAIRCIPTRRAPSTTRRVSKKTILLAEKLGVPVVIDFSGCPGDSDKAKYPNWVTCPWPPEYLDVLDWQWDKKVTPVLDQARQVRRRSRREDRDRDASGLRRLQPGDDAAAARHRRAGDRAATTIRATCSGRASIPSRPSACSATPSSTCTPKTRRSTIAICRSTGVLDTKKYTDERNRAWIFRTCGYGHGAEWWKEFVSTLRMFGYDYVLSIEHEDSSCRRRRPDQGHRIPERDRDQEQPAAAWWV